MPKTSTPSHQAESDPQQTGPAQHSASDGLSLGFSRRKFLAASLAGAAALGSTQCAQKPSKPNILWITCEDIGPELGCYGDSYATTPNLDQLAARGLRYLNAGSTAPVCAPARTTLITGVFPPSLGAEHMRSVLTLPPFMKMYPQLLAEAGYYVSNNQKKDYNLEEPGKVWDDSSKEAHWRNRAEGQPFFSIFNYVVTHESGIRRRPHDAVNDPAKVRVPAYHPDTPEVRRDWAQYYDNITVMDGQAGKVLAELEEDGLTEDTIVFFYGDHGSGMPRSKRWPYNSGLQVALLLYVPEKYRHLAPSDYQTGGTTDRPVGFVDLAPTLVSLAGTRPPEWMQGQAIAGPFATPAPKYQFGFRGRMDERYDMVRSCRDARYHYMRHFMPHRIYGQHIAYMFETPTTQVWKRLYDEGKLQPPQTYFWETKPWEELFDLEKDPDEVRNLAALPDSERSAEEQAKLEELRQATREWMLAIRDVGLLPEEEIHTRSVGSTPYEMAREESKFPVERILTTAEAASAGYGLGPQEPMNVDGLKDPDSAVRYWTAMGLVMRGQNAVQEHADALRAAMEDDAPNVRIVAAEALGRYGTATDAGAALDMLLGYSSLESNSLYVALAALNAIDHLGDRARPGLARLKAMPQPSDQLEPRLRNYVPRFAEYLAEKLS
jgi:arylsulfatase A-like enzyme